MLILDYPLRVNQKKIESGYSKFSMLLPNVQSPRLSRLVCNRNLKMKTLCSSQILMVTKRSQTTDFTGFLGAINSALSFLVSNGLPRCRQLLSTAADLNFMFLLIEFNSLC